MGEPARDTIIGIDLGTSNSCAAVASESGEVRLIPYKGGDFIIPSIFAIDDKGNELIGHEAKRQWQLNPRNTLYATKRLIGRSPMDDVVENVQHSVQYRVHAGSRNDVELDCQGRSFQVSEVASRILAKIRDVASDNLGFRVTRAVVTVPAYFTDRQRQAVKEAGKLVGLEVVRIINEPTAAALAYGLGKNLRERVLVYDLGGGTFDVSIIDIRDRVFEVKATAGDIFLGGIDFDNALIAYVLADFRRKHAVDLSSDPVAMQRIKDLAERTKIDLSSRAEAPFSIPFITMTPQGQPLNIDMRMDRALLEQLTEPLLDRSMEILARVLTDAGMSTGEIDKVMLVGGQTRMPAIQERLTTLLRAAAVQGGPPRRGRGHRRGPLRVVARRGRRATAAASRRHPHGHRHRAGRRRHPRGLRAQRRHSQRPRHLRHQLPQRPDRARAPHRAGRPPRGGPQRDARRVHLQRSAARTGRRGAPRDPLRGQRGGNPLGARPRPGHRPRDEDHGAGDAELSEAERSRTATSPSRFTT